MSDAHLYGTCAPAWQVCWTACEVRCVFPVIRATKVRPLARPGAGLLTNLDWVILKCLKEEQEDLFRRIQTIHLYGSTPGLARGLTFVARTPGKITMGSQEA